MVNDYIIPVARKLACKQYEEYISFEDKVSWKKTQKLNPWADRNGRYIDDEEAILTYGVRKLARFVYSIISKNMDCIENC